MITLAPLTNLAVALVREPELPRLLRGLVMMAGSYRSRATPRQPANGMSPVDPEAMQTVLSGWEACEAVSRPVALGLDVTERAEDDARPPRPAACRRRRFDRRTLWSTFVADALRFYMEFHSRYDGFYGAFIHDPLAVARRSGPRPRARPRRSPSRSSWAAADDRRDRHRLAPAGAGRPTSTSRSAPNVDRIPRPLHRTRRRAGGAAAPNVALWNAAARGRGATGGADDGLALAPVHDARDRADAGGDRDQHRARLHRPDGAQAADLSRLDRHDPRRRPRGAARRAR